MDIQKVIFHYKQAKQLLEIISDADHKLHDQVAKVCSVEAAQEMEEFVRGLDDHGIHLLLKGEAN